ncbi:phospholipase D family protein [Paracoccus luteus]|uniref:phospholipase D family protein n=1 Tax=Paracoccus luteus TaxID=2508543 RepID=UPI003CCC8EE8
MLTTTLILLCICAAAIFAAHLAFRPPDMTGRSVSAAIPASDRTTLGRAVTAAAGNVPHDSGVMPLLTGLDALGARIAVIRAAEETLDLQYYIWQRDATGLTLLTELHAAADRGVRIRLLLDDNGIAGLDADLAALNTLPTVEVRLFNPFILRRPKSLGFAFDFLRLNRRMHNKSLTADGAVTILGGRNIGDIYFSFGAGPHYLDTDVLAVGAVAADAGADFDGYWASGSAYPAELILPDAPGGLERTQADADRLTESDDWLAHRAAVRSAPLMDKLAQGAAVLEWAPVTLMSDDPAKGLGKVRTRDLLYAQLMRLMASPDRSVDIVSAYFVPGRRLTERLARLAGEGRRVRVLTNSQEATDVLVVHSAYVKYRPALLRGGVALFEMRATAGTPREPRVPGASTRASLHSKTVTVDGERIFIGSFNLDPRSVMLNTEMGVMIESRRVAAQVNEGLDRVLPTLSYGPVLDDRGRIVWHQPAGDDPVTIHRTEPGTNLAQRVFLWLLGRLPIEWLL